MELSEGKNIELDVKVEGKLYSTFNDFLQMGKEEALNTFGIMLGKYDTFEAMAIAKGWNSMEIVVTAFSVISGSWDRNSAYTSYTNDDFSRWYDNLDNVESRVIVAMDFGCEKSVPFLADLMKSDKFYTLFDEEYKGDRPKGY